MRRSPRRGAGWWGDCIWSWRRVHSSICAWLQKPSFRAILPKRSSPLAGTSLLPFDRGGRLRTDVVHDPVDALDLVHDPGADGPQHVVGDAGPVGRHPVQALDDAHADRLLVGALVAHDADALDGEEDG